MYLAFPCYHCGAGLEVPEESERWIQCPHCMAITEIPHDARRIEPPPEKQVAVSHEQSDPGPVEMRGRRLVCPVCDGERFWTRRTLMNTALATHFGLEYMDKTARNQICADCGYVFWFFED